MRSPYFFTLKLSAMTEAEHYYKGQYRKYLYEYTQNPAITRVAIGGEVVTREAAAQHRALHDLKVFKANNRKIKICCKQMEKNQLEGDFSDDSAFDPISVIANHKQPEKEPNVCLGGNRLSYCPFCAAPIVVLPFKDKRYVKPAEPVKKQEEEEYDDT